MSEAYVDSSEREQDGWLEAAFPWIASTLSHVGFFLLLAFTMFAVSRASREEAVVSIVIPPGIELVDENPLILGVGDNTKDEELQTPVVDRKLPLGKEWATVAGPPHLASLLGEDRGDLLAIGMGTTGVVGGSRGGIGDSVSTGPVGNKSGLFEGIGGGAAGA